MWLEPSLLPPGFASPNHPISMASADPPVEHGSCYIRFIPRFTLRWRTSCLLLQPGSGISERVPAKFIPLGPSYLKRCTSLVLGDEEKNGANRGMMDGGSKRAFYHRGIPFPLLHPGDLPRTRDPRLKTINAMLQQNKPPFWASLQGTCLFLSAQFSVKQNTRKEENALNA